MATTDENALDGLVTVEDGHLTAAAVRAMATAGVAAVSFWLAVVLPFLYIPLVLTGGSRSWDVAVLVALVGVNIVAVWFGHRYRS